MLIDAQGFIDGIGNMATAPRPLLWLGVKVLQSVPLRQAANKVRCVYGSSKCRSACMCGNDTCLSVSALLSLKRGATEGAVRQAANKVHGVTCALGGISLHILRGVATRSALCGE